MTVNGMMDARLPGNLNVSFDGIDGEALLVSLDSFFTLDERPELRDRKGPLLDAWPRFMLEDEVSNRCWDLLYERFGAFQHFLVSEDDELVAEVNSVPVELDPDALPERGWDEALERGTTGDGTPTVVSAIQVLIAAGRQGQGLSGLCLEHMR